MQCLSPLQPELRLSSATTYWSNLHGGSFALALSCLARREDVPILLLTNDSLSVERLISELHFYLQAEEQPSDIPVLYFPEWETLPYDNFSPYQDITSQRLEVLSSLPSLKQGILVASVTALMNRLMPKEYLLDSILSLKVGNEIDMRELVGLLSQSGYRTVNQAMEHGDLAVRGSLIDIFPMGEQVPIRIDFLGDEIESIRFFDLESQRSLGRAEQIKILPAHEIVLSEAGVARFCSRWSGQFGEDSTSYSIYQDVSQGIASPGVEYYLPLFYEQTDTLFDYVPENTLLVLESDIQKSMGDLWDKIHVRYEKRKEIVQPCLPPDKVFLAPETINIHTKRFHRICPTLLASKKSSALDYACAFPPKLPVDLRASEPLQILKKYLDAFEGRVLFVAESDGRRESLLELLAGGGIFPKQVDSWDVFLSNQIPCAITVALIEQGVLIEEPNVAVICEAQLFGNQVMQRRLRKRQKSSHDGVLKYLTELKADSPVVHLDHGVGRYRGLKILESAGQPSEFIVLEYADGDLLYVPVTDLSLISRYGGIDIEHAPLHKLGGVQWKKASQKAVEKMWDVAAELLDIYARRESQSGHRFDIEEDAYHAFVQAFPFEETPDQHDAILAVLHDLCQAKPMDRLICGDSGFGKTEIALRAAFIAVNGGRQVAILVPTTLLAQQHYNNFMDRFSDWPVKIALLSRFVDRKEQNKILAELQSGQVDIVIGTHKLLQDDVKFARLGLVILDEEHRFGVRQKEKLKSIRASLDVLTLTATPIPRTLNMALSGIREMSIISTPPLRRLAVKTCVREWGDEWLKEALLRETLRGGQVFFLHNDVKTIEKIASQVERLLPEAKVRVAHGQMRERELEAVMLDFYHRRFNVLVCTTIIETGIDVPSANTIIINHADKFGLAQLYQLRGRVGRSHHRAYAHLIIPPMGAITKDALKRLSAIESLEQLGVGFTLASHDLEIRGAGELLGAEQSGHIQMLGFSLYMSLLEKTVRDMKLGRSMSMARPIDYGVSIELYASCLIPETLVPDVHMRLVMYKRIASVTDCQALDMLKEEMTDRFGVLPMPTLNLFKLAILKLKAESLGIRKIQFGENGGRVFFDLERSINQDSIVQLIQANPHDYKLGGSDMLRLLARLSNVDARFDFLDKMLDTIALQKAA